MSSFAPKGHASVDAGSPQAFALCDCCQFLYLRSNLSWQFQYAGSGLINTGFLHCPTCLDVPNPQGLAISVPADPVPIWNPRSDAAENSQ